MEAKLLPTFASLSTHLWSLKRICESEKNSRIQAQNFKFTQSEQCLKIAPKVAFKFVQAFKKSPKLTIFGIFNELLSNQNVKVARFARNVE